MQIHHDSITEMTKDTYLHRKQIKTMITATITVARRSVMTKSTRKKDQELLNPTRTIGEQKLSNPLFNKWIKENHLVVGWIRGTRKEVLASSCRLEEVRGCPFSRVQETHAKHQGSAPRVEEDQRRFYDGLPCAS